MKLRFFAGSEHQEAAEMLGLSRRAADGLWLLAPHLACTDRTTASREYTQKFACTPTDSAH